MSCSKLFAQLTDCALLRLTWKAASSMCCLALTTSTGRLFSRYEASCVACTTVSGHAPTRPCQVAMEAHDVGNRLGDIKALLSRQGFQHIVAVQTELCRQVGLNNWQLYARRSKKQPEPGS